MCVGVSIFLVRWGKHFQGNAGDRSSTDGNQWLGARHAWQAPHGGHEG